MNAADFKSRVLVPLSARVPSVDASRLRVAYEDISSLARVHHELSLRCAGKDLAELTATGHSEQAQQLVLDGQAQAAQLKALYAFADVYFLALLHEARGRPLQQMTAVRFAEKDPKARQMAPEALLGAWCIGTYRARVLLQHEVPRTTTFTISADERLRLIPMPATTRAADQDLSARFHATPV